MYNTTHPLVENKESIAKFEDYVLVDVVTRELFPVSKLKEHAVLDFLPGPSHDAPNCKAPDGWGKPKEDARAPGCTKETKDLIKQAGVISKQGYEIYFISGKDPETQRKIIEFKGWNESLPSTVHFLFDKDLALSKALGLKCFTKSGIDYVDPIVFIINQGLFKAAIRIEDRTQEDTARIVCETLRQLQVKLEFENKVAVLEQKKRKYDPRFNPLSDVLQSETKTNETHELSPRVKMKL